MKIEKIFKKIKKSKQVKIWIGDPDQPGIGEWINLTPVEIQRIEENKRRIEQGPTLIEYDEKIAYNDERLPILYRLGRLK